MTTATEQQPCGTWAPLAGGVAAPVTGGTPGALFAAQPALGHLMELGTERVINVPSAIARVTASRAVGEFFVHRWNDPGRQRRPRHVR